MTREPLRRAGGFARSAAGVPLSTTLGSAAEGLSLIAGCRSSYGTRAPTAIYDHFRHGSRRWQAALLDHQQAREHTSVVIRPYEH